MELLSACCKYALLFLGLKVLLNNILIIKGQNRKSLDILQKSNIPIQNTDLPEDLKIKLAVESLEDLEELEAYLTHFVLY